MLFFSFRPLHWTITKKLSLWVMAQFLTMIVYWLLLEESELISVTVHVHVHCTYSYLYFSCICWCGFLLAIDLLWFIWPHSLCKHCSFKCPSPFPITHPVILFFSPYIPRTLHLISPFFFLSVISPISCIHTYFFLIHPYFSLPFHPFFIHFFTFYFTLSSIC